MRRFLLLCAATLSLGVTTAHGPRVRFGIVAFDLRGPVVDKLSELGVGLVRGSCMWGDLEPARGVFTWDCADNVIVGAAAADLRVYMTVTCTPSWANGGSGCAHMPADIGDWYAFVAQFVARYVNYRPILGVWNEPNLSLSDRPDGRGYALLYVNASRARDAVDPSFTLAGPETSHHALASGYYEGTMDAIQASGALAPQDIVGVHWYPDGPPIDDYLNAIHGVASRHDVWLTETGDATADPSAQATFYDQMLERFLSPTRPSWWTHVVFYRLWDGRDCCTEAILTSDYRNKPAFDTYRRRIEAASSASARPAHDVASAGAP